MSTQSKELMLQKDCLDLPIMDAVESCGEKCANLCRVYKLIMVSHVPGYGHLEYLVPGLSCESHHVTLN